MFVLTVILGIVGIVTGVSAIVLGALTIRQSNQIIRFHEARRAARYNRATGADLPIEDRFAGMERRPRVREIP